MDDLGLQDRMQVIESGAVAVLQTIRAMPLFKGEITGAIGGDNELPVEAKWVEHFVADQLAHTLIPQLAQRRGAHMAQEVIQGSMDGQRVLLGLGQMVGVGEHTEFQVAQLEVQVAAAA